MSWNYRIIRHEEGFASTTFPIGDADKTAAKAYRHARIASEGLYQSSPSSKAARPYPIGPFTNMTLRTVHVKRSWCRT